MLRLVSTLLVAIAILSMDTPTPAVAEPVRDRFVEAELVSEVRSIKAGEPFWAGLRLVMDPEWHTYWRNPGDSGLPTTLSWDLPAGFSAGELLFPYPERFERAPYVSYGYEGEVLLIAEIVPPNTLEAGQTSSWTARADWTVCREDLCVPGGAELMLELSTTDAAPERDRYWSAFFEKTRARLPQRSTEWKAAAALRKHALALTLTPTTSHDPGTITVMESDRGLLDHEKPVAISKKSGAIELILPLRGDKGPERFEAVLVASKHWDEAGRIDALEVSVPVNPR